VFAFDYAVRLRLAVDRWQYVRTHLPDLAAVLFPALRPLRLLRLFSVGNLLARRARGDSQGRPPSSGPHRWRSLSSWAPWPCSTSSAGRGRQHHYGGGCVLVGVHDDHDGRLRRRYPVTTAGRVITVLLMVVGIALIGVLTASIAA
jgi:voltage-gated potassium channel